MKTATVGNLTYTMRYNQDGIRTSKVQSAGGTTGEQTAYFVEDGEILGEYRYGAGTKKLLYQFDANGRRIGFTYNGTQYYYRYNLQGDVIAIVDRNADTVAKYTYDAWGKVLSVTNAAGVVQTSSGFIGNINPIRYRGYYYDTDLGLYYLQSRYYDPEIGRFVNGDAALGQVGNVQSTNMFAYCFNDPVNMFDPIGGWPSWSQVFAEIAIAAAAVAVVAAVVATCGAAAPALAVAGGGIAGGISAGAAAAAASVATGAMVVAGASAAAAVTSAAVEKAVEKTTKRNNSVYVLKDDTGTVQYVGRTNNVNRRRLAHSVNPARAGLEMAVIAFGLSLPESRALEQAGMAYYHTINTANKMNNQINSVSPKYWGAFKALALGSLNYGWNQMSNEILYWTGN